ncbi:SDR family NAD(P)-dependent oxidoreductase [Microbacterium sp. 2FI]|uniref:SDR family NAD(P)-dependent oxidoreductase n=1 Tax=Microbacterium sp. 2FI TaxID=2502193 RepID=UPI0010F7CCD7|nr:SDR family NAD(P)-dependent oxidoreductase [Microbacterium sp. 2FI]
MPRTIVITGASDGIGAAAARQLHAAGETVVIVGRDPQKTGAVAAELGAASFVVDYGDLSQVRDLAAALLAAYPRIDVLANNAGGVFADRTVTRDGFELTFQVNHLGGFLLTNLLLDRLIESRAAVIQTSSAAAHRFSRFDIDDLQGERSYSASTAYGNGKLANILFTKELHHRFHDAGLSAVAFHPGAVATAFAAEAKGAWRFLYHNALAKRMLISTDKGGSRLTWLAEGTPGETWISGEYYADNRPARTARVASDPAVAERLWEESTRMVGL